MYGAANGGRRKRGEGGEARKEEETGIWMRTREKGRRIRRKLKEGVVQVKVLVVFTVHAPGRSGEKTNREDEELTRGGRRGR